MRKLLIIVLISVAILVAAGTPALTLAEGLLYNENDKAVSGNYELNDLIKQAILIAKYVFGISGTIALAYFVYGGFQMIMSSASGKIDEAKKTIVNAVIGLVIIFASYMIVGFVLKDVLHVRNATYTNWAKVGELKPYSQ